jgi:hypothetical protein
MSALLRLFATAAAGVPPPYPSLAGVQTSVIEEAAEISPTLPSGIEAGELLFGISSFGRPTYANAPFPWQLKSGSAAWTVEHYWNAAPGSNWAGALLYWRIATGADTLTFETTTAENIGRTSSTIRRIAGASGVEAIARVDDDGLAGTWANPPELIVGTASRRLWGCAAVGSSGNPTNAPTEYSNLILVGGVIGYRNVSAWREFSGATQDPNSFSPGFGGPRMGFTWAINR